MSSLFILVKLTQTGTFPQTAGLSLLDERLQPGQRLIPLLGEEFEVFLDFLDRFRIELEQALAASFHAVHDSCAFEHAKMFRDRLPRQLRSFRQLRNGTWLPAAQLSNQQQPRLVSQCRKDRCTSPGSGRYAISAFARHTFQCSSFALSNHHHSCGTLPGDGRWGFCRSRTP